MKRRNTPVIPSNYEETVSVSSRLVKYASLSTLKEEVGKRAKQAEPEKVGDNNAL